MIGAGKKTVDVSIQSQTEALFQYFLMDEQKTDIILTASISIDDEIISVSAAHGFTAASGEYITVRNGDFFFQSKVISVSVNDITVEIPADIDFPITSSVIRGNINMNVDGSVTPIDFKYSSDCCGLQAPQTPIDLSTVIITMQHGANVPDDGKFGGIAALSKGMYFRKINGTRVNLGNYINNQAFKDVGAKVEYTDKAPAGTNATNITFDIENVFGKVIRIDPRTSDFVLAKVRDDQSASAGIDKLSISVIGSFTLGE